MEEKRMGTPIKPLADRIVAIRETAPAKTTSGLYLPENSTENSVLSRIVAVGPNVKTLRVGEPILYKDYSATELKIDSVTYLVIKEEDVLAILMEGKK